MKDYTKVCWYCDRATLELSNTAGKGWLKCSNCGATHQINPTVPGQPDLNLEARRNEEGERHFSPCAVRRSGARARSDV